MKDVIGDIDEWLARGEKAIALATVIQTWGSAPRRAGAKMAFTSGGVNITGSVSGGCVEGAVIQTGDEVLASQTPQLLHFGVPDETAWGVGLACGGTIEVFVEPLDLTGYHLARDLAMEEASFVVTTVVKGAPSIVGHKRILTADGRTLGSLGESLDTLADARAATLRHPARAFLDQVTEVFCDVMRPPPLLLIIGGAHIAVALVELAHALRYRTVLIDPRRAFGNAARFPKADRLIQAWPERALAELNLDTDTAVVTLSHDPKIDDPALITALRSDAFYVGALGSRKTHQKRRERLMQLGFDAQTLKRIRAPIGLDIGAESPEEIALAIMSEVVAAHRGRLGDV